MPTKGRTKAATPTPHATTQDGRGGDHGNARAHHDKGWGIRGHPPKHNNQITMTMAVADMLAAMAMATTATADDNGNVGNGDDGNGNYDEDDDDNDDDGSGGEKNGDNIRQRQQPTTATAMAVVGSSYNNQLKLAVEGQRRRRQQP